MRLPPVDATPEEVRAWVQAAVAALDTTPRKANWRYRALGMNYAEAMAEAPQHARIVLRIPVGEARVLRDVCRDHGLSREAYVRRVIGTWMSAIDDVDPDSIPWMLNGGFMR